MLDLWGNRGFLCVSNQENWINFQVCSEQYIKGQIEKDVNDTSLILLLSFADQNAQNNKQCIKLPVYRTSLIL